MKRFLAFVLPTLPCLAVDETQFVLQLREATANAAGAATETRRGIVQKLQTDLFLSEITVNSALVESFAESSSFESTCAITTSHHLRCRDGS